MTEAVAENTGVDDVSVTWTGGSTGMVRLHLTLGGATSDVTQSHLLLKVMHDDNMRQSLHLVNEVTAAAYGEEELLHNRLFE